MHDEYYTDGSMASDGWFSAKTAAPHRDNFHQNHEILQSRTEVVCCTVP